jgi:hypothetical protein
LTIKSNIPLLLCGSAEITLHVLCFKPAKSKTFCLQSSSPQIQVLVKPRPTLIHQNHIIHKEHAQGIRLWMSLATSSITKQNDKGSEPTLDVVLYYLERHVSSSLVRTLVTTLSYIFLMRVMYFVETLCFYKAHHMALLVTLS